MKHLLLFLMALLPLSANADAVEIDGIWYNLVSKAKTAEVTRNPLIETSIGCYSGSISIPSTVTHESIEYDVRAIGNSAFSYCQELTSISIPSSITIIGNSAFYCCSELTSVIIPNSVTSIGEAAFQGCWSMNSLTLSNNITTIENNTFQWCIGLLSISIPDGVINIGDYAFEGCSTMTSIDLPNSITNMGARSFSGCVSLKSISLPNTITNIAAESFSYCSGLSSINIPSNVTDIPDKAFQNCSSLSTITIGTGVHNIGANCFANCESLADLYCFAEDAPTTISTAFVSSYVNFAKLHVPASAISTYSASAPWSGFGEIVAITSEDITIGELGIGTFCGSNPIDFTGIEDIKAYVVSSYDSGTGQVTLSRTYYVPPFTGVVVRGSEGVHTIPAGVGQPVYPNMLEGVTTDKELSKENGDYTNYVLASKGGNLGFYAVSDGSTLAAGKAYLPLPTADLPSAARGLVLTFDDDEVTAINHLTSALSKGEDVYFDLQGRKVAQPTKGLYIVNGKKVIIK